MSERGLVVGCLARTDSGKMVTVEQLWKEYGNLQATVVYSSSGRRGTVRAEGLRPISSLEALAIASDDDETPRQRRNREQGESKFFSGFWS